MWGVELRLGSFTTYVQYKGEQSTSRPSRSIPEEKKDTY